MKIMKQKERQMVHRLYGTSVTRMAGIIILGANVLIGHLSHAAQELNLSQDSNLKASISTKGVNHISVLNDRIDEVIGNDEEYQIEGDNETGHVFITPKNKNGGVIHVTITTEKQVVQNLDLKVDDKISPQSIILKGGRAVGGTYSNHSQSSIAQILPSLASESNRSKEEIVATIKAIAAGDNLPNYTRNPQGAPSCLKQKNLQFVKGTKYKGSDLSIYEFAVKKVIILPEKSFKNCLPNIIAVSLQANKLYMVQENGSK
jgi:hypothetical protein